MKRMILYGLIVWAQASAAAEVTAVSHVSESAAAALVNLCPALYSRLVVAVQTYPPVVVTCPPGSSRYLACFETDRRVVQAARQLDACVNVRIGGPN